MTRIVRRWCSFYGRCQVPWASTTVQIEHYWAPTVIRIGKGCRESALTQIVEFEQPRAELLVRVTDGGAAELSGSITCESTRAHVWSER